MRNLDDWLRYRIKGIGTIAIIATDRIMLQDVTLSLYSSVDYDPRSFDHLWIYLREDDYSCFENYKIGEQIYFLGDVIKYQRNQGTSDYGIDYIKATDVKAALSDCAKISLERTEKLLQKLLIALKKRELFLPIEMSPAVAKKELEESLRKAQASIALSNRAISNQLRGKVNKDPVLALKGRKINKRGFG